MKYSATNTAKIAVVWRNNCFGRMLSEHLQAELLQPTEMLRRVASKASYDIVFLLLECRESGRCASLHFWKRLLSIPALVNTQIHVCTLLNSRHYQPLVGRIGIDVHILPQTREMFCEIIRRYKKARSFENAKVRIRHLLHEANNGTHTENFLRDLEYLTSCHRRNDQERYLKVYKKIEAKLLTFEKALNLYKDTLKVENEDLYHFVFVAKYFRIKDIMEGIQRTWGKISNEKVETIYPTNRFEILKTDYFKKGSPFYNHFITPVPCQ